MVQTTPLISVVTPFYNTAPFLAQCIESVLAQSYSNWEYVLVNNCSTDGSEQIARSFAKLDSRVSVIDNLKFLSQVENYNHALRQISTESKYCKIVQADDWLFRGCLERMAEVAEADPSVGYVTSYFLQGEQIKGGPVPVDTNVLDGRSVARRDLLEGTSLFGSPTTVLYRSDLVRNRSDFFDENCLHEDTDALFRILSSWNIGFVHDLLCFCRTDNESITSRVRSFSPLVLDRFLRVKMYAHRFLDDSQAASLIQRTELDYLRFVIEGLLYFKGRRFWKYHCAGWKTIGYSPGLGKVFQSSTLELLDLVANPKRTLSRYRDRFCGRQGHLT